MLQKCSSNRSWEDWILGAAYNSLMLVCLWECLKLGSCSASGPSVPSVPSKELPARGSSKAHCPSCATSPGGAMWIFAWSLPCNGDNWVIEAIIDRNQKNDLGHLMSLKTCVLDSLDKSPYVMRLAMMENDNDAAGLMVPSPNFHPSTSVEHGTRCVFQHPRWIPLQSQWNPQLTMQFFVVVFNEPSCKILQNWVSVLRHVSGHLILDM